MLNNIVLTRTSDSLVRNIVFLIFLNSLIAYYLDLLRLTRYLSSKGFCASNPLENTFSRRLVKQAGFEVLGKKYQVLCPVLSYLDGQYFGFILFYKFFKIFLQFESVSIARHFLTIG